MKESKHIHCRFEEDSEVIFLTKEGNLVSVERLRYTKLTGQTSGHRKLMSLQTARYRTSDLVKLDNELVFNTFRVMDEETKKHYDVIKAEIKAREEGLKDYLREKFMTQPFLKYEDVKKAIVVKDYERCKEAIEEVI